MGTVGDPVNPFQLVKGGDSLECLVSRVENAMLLDVLWEIELRARDGRERFFDDTPKGFASRLRTLGSLVR